MNYMRIAFVKHVLCYLRVVMHSNESDRRVNETKCQQTVFGIS
jgi:hypothetical protein